MFIFKKKNTHIDPKDGLSLEFSSRVPWTNGRVFLKKKNVGVFVKAMKIVALCHSIILVKKYSYHGFLHLHLTNYMLIHYSQTTIIYQFSQKYR